MRILLVLVLAGLHLSVCAQLTPKLYPKDPIGVQEFRLQNGLTVLLSPNPGVPQVFGAVVVRAGGKNDPADATGLAHYLEHMLFKGTTELGTTNYEQEKIHLDIINDLYDALGQTSVQQERDSIQKLINAEAVKAGEYAIPNEFDKLLASIGASGVNAFTTDDMTAYHNTFPANQMERWLDLYAHRFQNPVFRLFQSELETVYEEKNRAMDSPVQQAFETYLSHLFKNHPYGTQTVLGKTEHLKNPSLKRMYEYYNQYYVANNMALILAGDFNPKEAIRMIEQKFGSLRSGDVPDFPTYEEQPFEGAEIVEVNMTPIKVEVLGFRSPAAVHPDRPVADIINKLLTNEQQSGLMDQVTVNGEVMAAMVQDMGYADHGATTVIVIPKIIGQSFEKAEAVAVKPFERLRNGDFSDDLLEATKLSIRLENERAWETNQGRVYRLAFSWGQGKNWGQELALMRLHQSVTKEDVMAVAQRYYGDNYLLMRSKMGKPKVTKLAKPEFEPVIPKRETQSEYAKRWAAIPAAQMPYEPIDFETAFERIDLKRGTEVLFAKNEINKLFSVEIRYGIGTYDLPMLEHTASYLNLVGCDSLSATQFKEELFKLGGSVWAEANPTHFSLHLEGFEDNEPALMEWMLRWINNPQMDEAKVQKVRSDYKGMRRFERADPFALSKALRDYAFYADQSPYLHQLGKKQLKKMKADDLIGALRQAQAYETSIRFVGATDMREVINPVDELLKLAESPKPATKALSLPMVARDSSCVFVLPRKNTVQSQIWFGVAGPALNKKDLPTIEAFNQYFGNDMSSLVFQEIREFRSLAYSAHARYVPAARRSGYNNFRAYIGCQDDKTEDALAAMVELIRNMPQKRERMDDIKASLNESRQASKPHFRNVIEQVDAWKQLGLLADPTLDYLAAYRALTFDDILSFYTSELQSKSLRICIVGDVSRFDLKAIEAKYGPVTIVKEKALFAR